jgi:hypothetical protein
MNDNANTYLAICLGNQNSPQWKEWAALSEAEQKERMEKGMAAWKAWVETYKDAVVTLGGPLGKTKRADATGLSDVSNEMSGFAIVRAPSHEAAAKMFEGHPHFAIFPGVAIEIMPVLPVPGA